MVVWGAAREAYCLLLLSVFVGAIMLSSAATLGSGYLLVSSGGSSWAGWALATLQVRPRHLAQRLAGPQQPCLRRPPPPLRLAGPQQPFLRPRPPPRPQVWLALLPLRAPPAWFRAFRARAMAAFNDYFDVAVIIEGEGEGHYQQGAGPFIVGQRRGPLGRRLRRAARAVPLAHTGPPPRRCDPPRALPPPQAWSRTACCPSRCRASCSAATCLRRPRSATAAAWPRPW